MQISMKRCHATREGERERELVREHKEKLVEPRPQSSPVFPRAKQRQNHTLLQDPRPVTVIPPPLLLHHPLAAPVQDFDLLFAP